MMKMLKNIIFFVLFIYMSKINAQYNKNVDSLINIYSNLIYKNPDKAIIEGLKIANNTNSNFDSKIKAYKLISDGYSSKREYQKSLEYVIKAEQLLDKTSNQILKISIKLKAGIQYHQLKIYDKSMQYLDVTEKLCLNNPEKDSANIFLGTTYIVKGFIYKEKLNPDIAIAFLNKGINEINQSKYKNTRLNHISIAKYNIGNCYIQMSEYDLAIKYFKESYHYANILNASSLKAFALKGIAQVYTLQSKYKEAIDLLIKAKNTSENVNDLVLFQEIYKGLSENHLALNDWELYKKYYNLYLLNQSKLKENERNSISNLIITKEKNINQNINQKFSNTVYIYVLLFFSIISFFLIYSIVKTKKQITILNSKSNILKNNKTP
jgi:tetratricopeptide (TPR) repeat protein